MRTRWHIKLNLTTIVKILIFYISNLTISSALGLYFPCTTSLSSNGLCTNVDECLMGGETVPQQKGFDCPSNLICCPKVSHSKEIRLRQEQTCYNQIDVLEYTEDDPIRKNQFPWMVILRYHDTIKKGYFYGCVGSLISPSLVLTNAHCITKLEIGVKLSSVRMGLHDLNVDCPFSSVGNESSKECSDIQDFLVTHAWYPNEGDVVFTKDENGSHFKHDIGFLVIRGHAIYTKAVMPVCLLNVPLKIDNAKLVISGWKGKITDQVGQTDKILEQRTVKVVNSALCDSTFKSQLDEDRQLCIEEDFGDDQTCADLGDSGSMLHMILGGKISAHAISSYGQNSCQNGVILKVFTVIQPYIELMQEKSKGLGVYDFPMVIIEIS